MVIELLIENKLIQAFSPLHIDIKKEKLSFDVPEPEQFHFDVVIISTSFEGLKLDSATKPLKKFLRKN